MAKAILHINELRKNPAVIIGAGDTGQQILKKYEDLNAQKPWVEITSINSKMGADFVLDSGSLKDLYRNPRAYGLDDRVIPRVEELLKISGGHLLERELTKLNYFINGKSFLTFISAKIGKIQGLAEEYAKNSGITFSEIVFVIYLTSLAGGTGSGGLIDASTLTKNLSSNYKFIVITSNIIFNNALPDHALRFKILSNIVEALEELDEVKNYETPQF